MKKRLLALALVLCMAISALGSLSALAATDIPSDDLYDMLNAMGIMTYNENGDFEASRSLTRAQLAKILVTASPYKGEASASRTSPFSDVSYQHWAAPYIKVAQTHGIMNGYSDGTFRPEQDVTLEETLSAVLGLLGYTPTGAYPYAQHTMAQDLDLLDGVTAELGEVISRDDAATIMYNALNANANGDTRLYAEKLGYSVSGDSLSLSDIVNQNAKGPYTYTGTLPITPNTVFIDGQQSTVSGLSMYDIYYYSDTASAIYAYTDRTTGTLESVSPSREAPTSVVISGQTISLSGYDAKTAAGTGGLALGATVTVLHDNEGKAANIIAAEQVYTSKLGVVTREGTATLTGEGGEYTSDYLTVAFTNGDTMDIETEGNMSYLVGRTVEVSFAGGTPTVTTAVSKSVQGYFDMENMTIGSDVLTSGVTILEVDEMGNMIELTPTRLDGVLIDSDNVMLCSTNSAGKVDSLILKDVTNDGDTYGYATYVKETDTANGSTSNYTVDLNGTEKVYTLIDDKQGIKSGPVHIFTDEDGDTNLDNLDSITLSGVYGSYATDEEGDTHRITGSTKVYDMTSGTPVISTLDRMAEGDYTLTAYVDKDLYEGGAVRVIVYK